MSAFGNVPDEDLTAVTRVSNMASQVVRALPAEAPHEWYAVTYEIVLQAALKDWVEHGTEDLDSGDAEDLENLVRASASVALQQEPALQGVAYKTVLTGWLADWVANWGAEE